MTSPHQITIDVTPSLARDWLARNERNRPISEHIVRRYAADMRGDRWRYTADPIRFDRDGRLIDGQHRLRAVIKSETTVPMLVVTGLDPEAQLFMDQGRKRTAGQQLSLIGVKNATTVATGVQMIINIERGGLFGASLNMSEIGSPDIIAWVGRNPHTMEIIQRACKFAKGIDIGNAPLIAFAVQAYEFDAEAAEKFLTQLHDATEMRKGDAVHTLYQWTQNVRRKRIHVHRRDALAFLIRSFNYHIHGVSLTLLRLPRDGVWTPDNFPTIGERPATRRIR